MALMNQKLYNNLVQSETIGCNLYNLQDESVTSNPIEDLQPFRN